MASDEKKAKKRVVTRGRAIRRTDEEIEEMTSAEAMMELAEDAGDDWRENAPRDAKDLLDAESDE